jgi:hypothetical protein
MAAAQYDTYEFVPGPWPDAATPPADCERYDEIWTVTQPEVARLIETGEVSEAVATWPFDLGAPVVDGDGDPEAYDPSAGDYPALHGTQTAFWVMNDGGPHPETRSEPLGVEVQVLAWAVASPVDALHESTTVF